MDFIRKNIRIITTAAIVLAAVLIFLFIFIFVSCSINTKKYTATKAENGYVQINTNLAELKEQNIEYGDAVDVKFDSGSFDQFTPVLNGDFLNPDERILKATNDTDNVLFYLEYNPDSYKILNIENNPGVTITLREKAKYKDLYEASNQPISQDQKDMRALKGGNLKYLDMFRGIAPSVSEDVASTTKYYFSGLNITNIVDLDNNDKNLHQLNIKNKACSTFIVDTLKSMSLNQNRTYICSANSDMRAYFCALIECISNASYEQIVTDYMETYKNLYGISKESNLTYYNAIKKYHIDQFLHKLTKTGEDYDMSNLDFSHAAEMYLRANGLKDDQVNMIKARFNTQY